MVNIESTKCTGCGSCAADCVGQNITLKDGKAQAVGSCILCGHCVAICPVAAVSIPEYDMADVSLCENTAPAFDIGAFLHTVKARRSIRAYADKPIEREKLENIVQAGRYTATGVNRQGCRFIVAQQGLPAFKELVWGSVHTALQSGAIPEDTRASFTRFARMHSEGADFLFRNAPALIYIAAKSTVDAALAAQNMELAAIAQGLGALYNGFLIYSASLSPAIPQWLGTQDKPLAVCMLLGYPAVHYPRTAPRRPANAHWL